MDRQLMAECIALLDKVTDRDLAMFYQPQVCIEDVQIIAPQIDLDGLIYRQQVWEAMSPEAQNTFQELIVDQEIDELRSTKVAGKRASKKMESIFNSRRVFKFLKRKHGTKQKAEQILAELKQFSREI